MRDRETGRSRGFGFVTYSSTDEANAAIQNLHEQTLDGRRIKVNIANAKPAAGASSVLQLMFSYGNDNYASCRGRRL